MKYYVFKKLITLPCNNAVILNHPLMFTTIDNFNIALEKYNNTKNNCSGNEVVFLLVDFGINNKRNNYIIPESGYFPFLILDCSAPDIYDYNTLYGIQNLKLLCISDGIEQTFNSLLSGIKKFDYYLNSNIDAELCIKYNLNTEENIVNITSTKNILSGSSKYFKEIILWDPNSLRTKIKDKFKNLFKAIHLRVEG